MFVQDTICQCKQLSSLHIAFEADDWGDDDPDKDASDFLMDIAAALPKLATLQWEERPPVNADPDKWQFSPAFSARKADGSPAGAGLRLLHAEKCMLESVSGLPASLQVLSMCNRVGDCFPLREGLDQLLAPCAALRELYLVHTYTLEPLDLPAIAAACPKLRVLVLHIIIPIGHAVSPSCTPIML